MTAPCAQDANAAASGSPIGQESQPSAPPTSFPAGLLQVRVPGVISQEQAGYLQAQIEETATALNLEPLILFGGAEASIHTDNTALIAAMHAQVEAINRLAASNEALVQAMAEAEDEEDEQPGRYMDGTKAR
jgi:hypothetical protein